MNRDKFTIENTQEIYGKDSFGSLIMDVDMEVSRTPEHERFIFKYDMFVKWGVNFRAPYHKDHPAHYNECESQAWQIIRHHAYDHIMVPFRKVREAIYAGDKNEAMIMVDQLERAILGK